MLMLMLMFKFNVETFTHSLIMSLLMWVILMQFIAMLETVGELVGGRNKKTNNGEDCEEVESFS